MEEKQKILEKIMPVAVLRALTPEAERSIPQPLIVEGLVTIRNFPFRIGRESRVKMVDGRVERIERAKFNDTEPNNDLYLIDDGHLLNISREHFQIERDGDHFYLYDRGSACGTRVGDKSVGGEDSDGSLELKDGDTIVIGTKNSPYGFQFIVLDQFEIRVRGQ